MLSLHLNALCSYANATPSSRNMIEGQNVINSGLIIMCGVTSKSHEKINIFSLCLQTSKLTSDPHIIKGVLSIKYNNNNNENTVDINEMICSCKAGTSHSCKHIVAVLLYCNRIDLNKLEVISCTDQKCVWKNFKKPVLEQFDAKPVNTFCCVQQERLILTEDKLIDFRNRLINCDSESAIAKHRNRNKDVSNILLELINDPLSNEKTSGITSVYLKKRRLPLLEITHNENIKKNKVSKNYQNIICDFTQSIITNASNSEVILLLQTINFPLNDCCEKTYNTAVKCDNVLQTALRTRAYKSDWKKERQYRITGSRCYSLFTYSKCNWSDKALKYFWPKEFKNKFTMHGNAFEGVAKELYAKETDLYIQDCGLIVCESEPWMAYSPDGIVIKESILFRLLEIKCPYQLENTENETLLKKCKFLHLEKNEVKIKKKTPILCPDSIWNGFIEYKAV